MSITSQPGVNQTPNWFDLFDSQPTEQVISLLISQSISNLKCLFHMKDTRGFTLLHKACMKSDVLLTAVLLKLGFPPNVQSNSGLAAVHIGAMKGQPVILSLLQKFGANLSQTDIQGRLPIHHAIGSNQLITLIWLLNSENQHNLNSHDLNGITPIHLACNISNRFIVNYLIDLLNGKYSTTKEQSNSILDTKYFFEQDYLGNHSLHMIFMSPLKANSNVYEMIRKETTRKRADELVWSLLNASKTENSSKNTLSLVGIKNASNEKPIDLARRISVSYMTICLLIITEKLLASFKPSRAQLYLDKIYKLTWLYCAVLPLLFLILSSLCSSLFISHPALPYIIGSLGLLWIVSKQKHRIQDGTNRPNPFFASFALTGFGATCYSYYFDILSQANISSTINFCQFFLFTILALSLIVIFVHLVHGDPGNIKMCPSIWTKKLSLANVVEMETTKILNQINEKSLDQISPHLRYSLLNIPDLYCGQCDFIMDITDDNINHKCSRGKLWKHCNLCCTCVIDLNHHCLFLMNCIGYLNHNLFLLFLLNSIIFIFYYELLCLSVFYKDYSNSFHEIVNILQISDFFYNYSNIRLLFMVMLNFLAFLWISSLFIEQLNSLTSDYKLLRSSRRSHLKTCFNCLKNLHKIIPILLKRKNQRNLYQINQTVV